MAARPWGAGHGPSDLRVAYHRASRWWDSEPSVVVRSATRTRAQRDRYGKLRHQGGSRLWSTLRYACCVAVLWPERAAGGARTRRRDPFCISTGVSSVTRRNRSAPSMRSQRSPRGVPACYGIRDLCQEVGSRPAARGHDVRVRCRSVRNDGGPDAHSYRGTSLVTRGALRRPASDVEPDRAFCRLFDSPSY